MESTANEKTTNPATSPSQWAEFQDFVTNNLGNFSLVRSPRTGPTSPEIQNVRSHPNLDRQTAYPKWSSQPQLPSSEFYHQAQVGTSYAAQSPQMFSPSYNPASLNRTEYRADPYSETKFISQYPDTDTAANLYQPSHQERRKKPDDDNDCKRCTCKKTRCLKLYCECFSSGYYCAKTCNCQECYNTIDYEDTVQTVREKIEVRNPLAFTPKLGGGIFSTPSSEKYRRGCNCRKSMCLKKYCECYQSNIGCTNGCHCEGCENSYGKKSDYNKIQDMSSGRSIRHIFENASDEKLQMVVN